MKKDLSKIINNVQNTDIPPFPLDNSELASVLDRVDRSESSGNSKLFTKRGIKMTSIITSILMLGIFGINYLSNDPQPATVKPQTGNVKQEKTAIEEKGNKEVAEIGKKIVKKKIDKNNDPTIVNFKQHDFHIKINEQQVKPPYDIKYLELTNSELEKLGIIHVNGSYSFVTEELVLKEDKFNDREEEIDKNDYNDRLRFHRVNKYNFFKRVLVPNGYDTSLDKILYREKFLINIQKSEMLKMKYEGWSHNNPLKIAPIAVNVTHTKFVPNNDSILIPFGINFLSAYDQSPLFNSIEVNVRMFQTEIESSYRLNIYSKYFDRFVTIQIKIPADEKVEKKNQKEALIRLLYIPTPEFLEALPDRYKTKIQTELTLLDKIENKEISVAEACSALKGEDSYIDLCHTNSDIIKEAFVAPNPISKDIAILYFTLTEMKKFKIDLYSFKTGFIKEIKSDTFFPEGENKELLNLGDCENGIYMIVITDNNGNQVVKKFIISR